MKINLVNDLVDVFFCNFEERGDFMNLTTASLAKELDISYQTLYSWIRKGQLIPDVTLPSGRRMFSEQAVRQIKSDLKIEDKKEVD